MGGEEKLPSHSLKTPLYSSMLTFGPPKQTHITFQHQGSQTDLTESKGPFSVKAV